MLTRCVNIHSFSLRAGIAYADAYASLHGPGFCFCEVLIATPQQKMNYWVLNVAQIGLDKVGKKINVFSQQKR